MLGFQCERSETGPDFRIHSCANGEELLRGIQMDRSPRGAVVVRQFVS